MRHAKKLVALLFIFLLFAACSKDNGKVSPEPISNPATERVPQIPLATDTSAYKAGLARIKANEAGKIMILMYHVIGAEKEADWAQTSDNFRRDLQTLYEQGYSLIRLKDLLDNNISTPAGRTPVVLTFDDGTAGHFRYIVKDGQKEIDPDCAVGILLDFAKKHPEFGHTATFYVNDRPFGQAKYYQEKLRHLVSLGFDIGNHTLTHPKLNKISAEEVQKEIAGLAQMVEEAVPGYKVNSIALPHGISPQQAELAVAGSYNGYSYYNEAVLRVGANPTVAPNVIGFDPAKMPRVQASTEELSKWLKYFQEKPEEKYISDGDPNTVSIPSSQKDKIDENTLQQKKLIIW